MLITSRLNAPPKCQHLVAFGSIYYYLVLVMVTQDPDMSRSILICYCLLATALEGLDFQPEDVGDNLHVTVLMALHQDLMV